MKFWHVYFDANKQMYKLEASNMDLEEYRKHGAFNSLCCFWKFDMAYDYVTKANKMTDVMAYSRWAR
jgi:hypothetical protein